MSEPKASQRLSAWLRRNRIAVTAAITGLIVFGGIAVVIPAMASPDHRHSGHRHHKKHYKFRSRTAAPTSQSAISTQPPSPSASASPSSGNSTTPGGPPSSSGFPNESNTGVPADIKLTPYTGSCAITTANTVIDSKIVNCNLAIRAKGVVIKNSKINGYMDTEEETEYSFTLQDSEVNAGVVQRAAVGTTNMTILRANIHGGQTSVYCYKKCVVRDTYMHAQGLPSDAPWHLGAFLANDGPTDAVLVHNTIVCDTKPNAVDGGCSGDINLYGDFGSVSGVTLENNLFGANTGVSYCLYGGESKSKPYPQADHIVVINNTFQRGANRKCGAYGPVTSFDTTRPGNKWANNRWDDGGEVNPEN